MIELETRLLRNTVFGSFAGCSATICNFVCGLIIARKLGPQQMGEVAFLIWIASTIAVVVAFGVPFTMSKYLLDVEARDGLSAARSFAAWLLRRFIAIALLPVGLAFILAASNAPLRTWLRHISPSLGSLSNLVLISLLCFLFAAGEFSRSLSRGTNQFDSLARVSVISGIVQVLAAYLCVSAFGVTGALTAYAIGCAAFLVLLSPAVGVEPRGSLDQMASFRRFATYRWGSELLALFVWCRIEVVFLQHYCGASAVALFTVALTLTSLAVQGPLMLTWGLVPHFVERIALADHRGTQSAFESATRLLALLVLPCCFGMAAISHSLISVLFGPTFVSSQHLAEILVIASAYPAIASVGSSALLAADRSDVDFFSCLAGTIVSILLGLFLTKHYGLIGAAWSRVVVQLGVNACTTLFLCLRMKLVPPVMVLGKLTLCAACCALVAAVISRVVPGLPSLILAILAGAATYAGCLRAFSVLDDRELELLRRASAEIVRPLLKPLAIYRSTG